MQENQPTPFFAVQIDGIDSYMINNFSFEVLPEQKIRIKAVLFDVVEPSTIHQVAGVLERSNANANGIPIYWKRLDAGGNVMCTLVFHQAKMDSFGYRKADPQEPKSYNSIHIEFLSSRMEIL